MLTKKVLKSYLGDMPRGHVFDLPYPLYADVFPPGEPDSGSREKLRAFAEECDCDVAHNAAAGRFELIRR